MFIEIAGILGAADLRLADTVFAQKDAFESGARTAGRIARAVKNNEQAKPAGLAADLTMLVEKRLMKNDVFRAAARPRNFIRILLSRYTQGMAYGLHSDDAFMERQRVDLSFTLFLSPPESYEGGELIVEEPAGERLVKLEAGSLVLYPSATLHRVAEVTSGERRAAVGWIRSLVRSAEDRETLFDVALALRQAEAAGDRALTDRLLKIQGSLLRRWGED
ncbi:2OG-Fe(II) oxygenase [Parvibaculum lavamentivorans DS-1]|uniref:PKHD-type hydroxylase Plav_0037 n=1 Tax=Parvibaculum lavamentivorans (strain DS-1 / DSM 13023 / NCIMB 13966) TaxID=402881 RepID=Y037_PARL1|nr:Fe2+-dependent dioxygenase [Parvibaculum lavamentivorans]A7HP27.1 RecName: Full=PKHD-type hydroxylase Plav_0037 [Parvibaculum lavamentivorans DS-1]ABS61660.1 2OG-Fe(II) oxygenase [Parvibaculum lavamentivorans DS-1]